MILEEKKGLYLLTLLLLCLLNSLPGATWAQDPEIEALKDRLREMEQEMQKMRRQMEQRGQEKAAEATSRSSPDPQSSPEGTKTPGGSSAFNPAISVNGLFLGGFSSSPRRTRELTGLDFHNGFNFQEAELQFTADVDPYWKANFILGVDRGGEAELEEGYVTSEELPYGLLPANMSLKLGKFFPFFGKHNLLHAHQFPFIDRPLIHQSVFGDEGLKDPGLGLSYLLPSPWFSELTFQALAGENEALFRFPQEPERDARRRGAYLGHWKNFFDLTDSTTLEVGNSYLAGRNSAARHKLSQAAGFDLTLKWRPLQKATERGLIWQSEYLYFSQERGREPSTKGGGLYTSLQYQFARRWWIQGRYDLSGIPKFEEGKTRRWSALLAFVLSEFSAIRLQHSYTWVQGSNPLNQIFIQFNFTIGSHPAHQY